MPDLLETMQVFQVVISLTSDPPKGSNYCLSLRLSLFPHPAVGTPAIYVLEHFPLARLKEIDEIQVKRASVC